VIEPQCQQGTLLREIIRTWPKAPAEQHARDTRDRVIKEWESGFAIQWREQRDKASSYFPYAPDEDTPDVTAIKQLGVKQQLTLFEASLLIGLYHHVGPALYSSSSATVVKDIFRGEINPRSPSDMRLFSELADNEDTPCPDWLMTREEVEQYSLSRWKISTYKETAEEREKKWNEPISNADVDARTDKTKKPRTNGKDDTRKRVIRALALALADFNPALINAQAEALKELDPKRAEALIRHHKNPLLRDGRVWPGYGKGEDEMKGMGAYLEKRGEVNLTANTFAQYIREAMESG